MQCVVRIIHHVSDWIRDIYLQCLKGRGRSHTAQWMMKNKMMIPAASPNKSNFGQQFFDFSRGNAGAQLSVALTDCEIKERAKVCAAHIHTRNRDIHCSIYTKIQNLPQEHNVKPQCFAAVKMLEPAKQEVELSR